MVEELRQKLNAIFLDSSQPQLKDLGEIVKNENDTLVELCGSFDDDGDEKAWGLAKELKETLLPYLDDSKNLGLKLLPPLEKLAAVGANMPGDKLDDVCSVRNEAVKSLRSLAATCSTVPGFQDALVRVVLNLAESWVGSRVSAFGLVSVCYENMSQEQKSDLLRSLKSLSDGLDSVETFTVVGMEIVKDTLVALYHATFASDEVGLRTLALEVGIWIAASASLGNQIESLILDRLFDGDGDLSSDVDNLSSKACLKIADNLFRFQCANAKELLSFYTPLLEKVEVGKEAALNLKDFCKELDWKTKVVFVKEILKWLNTDAGTDDVKSTLVETMMDQEFSSTFERAPDEDVLVFDVMIKLLHVLKEEFKKKNQPKFRLTVILKLHVAVEDIKNRSTGNSLSEILKDFPEEIFKEVQSVIEAGDMRVCQFVENVMHYLVQKDAKKFEVAKEVYTSLLTANGSMLRNAVISHLRKLLKAAKTRFIHFLRKLEGVDKVTMLCCFGEFAEAKVVVQKKEDKKKTDSQKEKKDDLLSEVLEMKNDSSVEVRKQLCLTLRKFCPRRAQWSQSILEMRVRNALEDIKNEAELKYKGNTAEIAVINEAEAVLSEVFRIYGLFQSKCFEFVLDEADEASKANTELWIRLWFSLLAINPLLHSLAEKVMGKLVDEFKKEPPTMTTWSQLLQFLTKHYMIADVTEVEKPDKENEQKSNFEMKMKVLALHCGVDIDSEEAPLKAKIKKKRDFIEAEKERIEAEKKEEIEAAKKKEAINRIIEKKEGEKDSIIKKEEGIIEKMEEEISRKKASKWIEKVVGKDSFLFLYLYINAKNLSKIKGDVAPTVKSVDPKDCIEFLENCNIGSLLPHWGTGDDKRKWRQVLKYVILFRNVCAHKGVVEFVKPDEAGATVEDEIDKVFTDFVDYAERVWKEDDKLFKKQVEIAKAALAKPVKKEWTDLFLSEFMIIFKGASKKGTHHMVSRMMVLLKRHLKPILSGEHVMVQNQNEVLLDEWVEKLKPANCLSHQSLLVLHLDVLQSFFGKVQIAGQQLDSDHVAMEGIISRISSKGIASLMGMLKNRLQNEATPSDSGLQTGSVNANEKDDPSAPPLMHSVDSPSN